MSSEVPFTTGVKKIDIHPRIKLPDVVKLVSLSTGVKLEFSYCLITEWRYDEAGFHITFEIDVDHINFDMAQEMIGMYPDGIPLMIGGIDLTANIKIDCGLGYSTDPEFD